MTIARRLLLLLATPLAALVGLGVFAGLRLANIETHSRFVAESRIVALATLGNLTRSATELRVNVRGYLLANDDAGRADSRARFDVDERELNQRLQDYADRLVLGDRERRLLTDFQTLSREYIAGARDLMRLVDQGRRAEAEERLRQTVAPLGLRLSVVSNEWIDHVRQAATEAGTASIAGIERFQRQVAVALLAALVLTGVLGVVTMRGIVNPIRGLDTSVKAIAAGDYARPVPFVEAADEAGGLARSIDVLKTAAALMDDQRWVKSHVSGVTAELQKAESLAGFGERLLSNVVPIVGGGVGAFYTVDDGDGGLRRAAAYGLSETSQPPGSIKTGQGLVGQCALERRPVVLTNLPADYLHIASGTGDAAPAEARALPVISKDALLGVLELASFRRHDGRHLKLLDELLPVVGMALDILQRNLRTQQLLERTQQQAEQLEHQTADLRRSEERLINQADELLAQQDELERQRQQLEVSEGELRKGSEQLQRINFLADTALELTKAGYWHVPLDGSGWYNSSERAARIFGDIPNPDFRYRVDEWAEHVREGDEDAWRSTMENFTAAIEGRIPAYSSVYAYKRPIDGQVVWIRALGSVVKDADGKPVDMFGVTQDVTSFKQLERELLDAKLKAEEATEMKSMFLANMSHEIRTPMNAIIGLSHLALKTPLSAKQRDYITKVHAAGTSLLSVINDILDFSKIEAGRLDIEAVDFTLDEVIGSVTTITAQKAHEKGLEFLAHVAPDIPDPLVGDPLRLGQILTNLVNNAVKFTERGEVRVDVECLERTAGKVQLQFSVHDTGTGMTPAQAAKLFQPFVQADMSTTRRYGGTGLGLTICRRLVELMGGRIWLDSRPGAGTTFYFTVTLGVGAATAPRTIVPGRLAGLRALIVDDNPTAREILQESLGAVVRRVDAAASGKEAIATIRQEDGVDPYDIVFMDWRMPGMDGLQASRYIRSDETLARQPAVVLVTAFGREEVREEAEQLQLEGFLVKPVTKSMIVDTLVNVFAEGDDAVVEAQGGNQTDRLRGVRVLLTEDNEINQQIACELLEGAGAAVDVASNGREAVERLSAGHTYDIVLMDLQMPEMDGFQATARLRSDPRFATLAIVAMTAHATTEERLRCLAAGMNDHIAKPIDPEQLIATVARFRDPARSMPADAPATHAQAREAQADRAAGDLPAIDGLDVRDGLARVGGNQRLYRSLLRQFVDQQRSAIARAAEAIVAGDVAVAERAVHSLRGVAANIGAAGVQMLAARLEGLIRDRAPAADIDDARREAADALGGLVARMESAIGPKVVEPEPVTLPASVDPSVSRDAASRLATLLAEFDPAASTFVEANQAALRPLFGATAWPAFEALVTAYEFAGALRELDSAIARFSAR